MAAHLKRWVTGVKKNEPTSLCHRLPDMAKIIY